MASLADLKPDRTGISVGLSEEEAVQTLASYTGVIE
jgi:hypothetical protein